MSTSPAGHNMLSARYGARYVTIGHDPPETLHRLSDGRELTCPGCGAMVVLHAGSVRAHHFAHLPGSVCSLPQTEPETDEHRAGKLLIARWLRERVPEAAVTIEAFLAGTNQRADVLLEALSPDGSMRRAALEFQCANLSAREWSRRHSLYRDAGLQDLWILGGSRFCASSSAEDAGRLGANDRGSLEWELHPGDLERALLAEGAPLLFLDSTGISLAEGALARFRSAPSSSPRHPRGRISARLLLDLEFPWDLLDWPARARTMLAPGVRAGTERARQTAGALDSGAALWQWLASRHRVTPDSLPPLFGVEVEGCDAILCESRLWQAAAYFRFIHGRIGSRWWLAEVETWARAYLPLPQPAPLRKLRQALRSLQEIFAAAGLLTLPVGNSRASAVVTADLDSLPAPPDREQVVRLARYRRLLDRP